MAFATWEQARDMFMITHGFVAQDLVNLENALPGIGIAATLADLRTRTKSALTYVKNALRDHTGIVWLESVDDSSHYQAIGMISAGSVDMDAILSAMLLADRDQLTKFIGIEDAYRSAIWDQPFNSEFYAALARGFRA